MATLEDFSCLKKNLLFLYVFSLLFITPSFISAHLQNQQTSRFLSELDENEDHSPTIKKPTKIPQKNNQTKLTKPTSNYVSSKNQTKLTTNIATSKNQTKSIKPPFDSSSSSKTNKTKPIKTEYPATTKSQLNSTSKPSKNSTSSTLTNKKSSDLPKNNNTATSKEGKKGTTQPKPKPKAQSQPKKAQNQPNWMDEDDDDDDLVAEFRALPSKFQESIVPDLEKISKTSQTYLTQYNKEFTKGFKPYVGNKYASTFASCVSFAFILIPLLIVSLIFSKIKAYFSLQKLLIFIQVYLAIYFSILCFSALATGLEPLKFFYSTSRSTYVCVQVLQTLAYVLYLLVLLMYLILVFSTDTGLPTKMLGLGQTFVGFAVGLHYYMTVFHRAVLHQPPKSGWKVHGLYATCFFVVCLLGRLDRRKKAYLVEGCEEGKKS